MNWNVVTLMKTKKSFFVSLASILILGATELLFLRSETMFSTFSLIGKIFFVVGPVVIPFVIATVIQLTRGGVFPDDNYRTLVWIFTGIFFFEAFWMNL